MPSETLGSTIAKQLEYEKLKKQLHQQIINKRNLDKELTTLEEDIFNKETTYFENSTYGNIIKGFENFTKNSSSSSNRKKVSYTDDDRIFSLSSSTYVRHLKKMNEDNNVENGSISFDDLGDDDLESTPSTTSKRKHK